MYIGNRPTRTDGAVKALGRKRKNREKGLSPEEQRCEKNRVHHVSLPKYNCRLWPMGRLFDSDRLGPAGRIVSKAAQDLRASYRKDLHTRWILHRPHSDPPKAIRTTDLQIPREIDIESIHNRQMVAKKLQRDNVQNSLKAIDRAGDYNLAPASLLEGRVVLTADNNRLSFAGSNLREGRLDLGVERVARHDDDHRHVLVDKREWAMLEFAGEDTCRLRRAISANLRTGVWATYPPSAYN